jgi:hypothetical protein
MTVIQNPSQVSDMKREFARGVFAALIEPNLKAKGPRHNTIMKNQELKGQSGKYDGGPGRVASLQGI